MVGQRVKSILAEMVSDCLKFIKSVRIPVSCHFSLETIRYHTTAAALTERKVRRMYFLQKSKKLSDEEYER